LRWKSNEPTELICSSFVVLKYRSSSIFINLKGHKMKTLLAALIAGVFAASAFAQNNSTAPAGASATQKSNAEVKADTKAGKQAAKADAKASKADAKSDKKKAKADAKAGKEKVDAKADKAEAKADAKADRAEAKADRVEAKADKAGNTASK
jgi:hypothetical protein